MGPETAKFQFSLQDQRMGKEISLENVDLGVLSDFAKQVQSFLKGEENLDLENVEVKLTSGSTVFQVEAPEAMAGSLIRDLDHIAKDDDLSGVDPKRAKIVKDWQGSKAVREGRRSYGLKKIARGPDKRQSTSEAKISKDSTYRLPQTLVDVELYLKGQIETMGGKSDPNIHMTLETGESLIIDAGRELLRDEEHNPLYKDRMVRVKAKKNTKTQALKDAEVVSFEPPPSGKNNPDKYDQLAKKGAVAWGGVPSASKWVEEMRGNLE